MDRSRILEFTYAERHCTHSAGIVVMRSIFTFTRQYTRFWFVMNTLGGAG